MKKHYHLIDRVEADDEKWRDKEDEELGDIIKEDDGGFFRLIPDDNGTIVRDPDGQYQDIATGQRFKTSTLPEGRRQELIWNRGVGIPVRATRSGNRDEGEEGDA